jgi:hypothetical protein
MVVLPEPNAPAFELLEGEEPYFAEERDGWKGYVEWEHYPEKKKEAAAVLAKYQFPPVNEQSSQECSKNCQEERKLTTRYSRRNFNWHHYLTRIPSSRVCDGSTTTTPWARP